MGSVIGRLANSEEIENLQTRLWLLENQAQGNNEKHIIVAQQLEENNIYTETEKGSKIQIRRIED